MPLLFEKGLEKNFDICITVFCSETARRERLLKRGMSEHDIDARDAYQLPLSQKVRLATVALFNEGDFDFLYKQAALTLNNLKNFFVDPNPMGTLCYSIVLAVTVTLVCLVIAYPVAYILAGSALKRKGVILMLFVLPMWINFTLRITALKEILSLIEGNLAFHPFLNTVIGMTYDFLPFMILPLYTTLSRLDSSLIEAAGDLGADSFQTFIKVIFPLSIPGIVSGVSMVFLPAMTNYVVLDMLYNSTYIMGSLIGSYFSAYDWHNGSMIALILLFIIGIVAVVSEGNDTENAGRGLV